MSKKKDIVIIGGGAAGFFAAINIATHNPSLSVIILERGKTGLQKVKVSGGGRCNVTHAEFIPSELIENYPRGKKELLGPFHTFMTGDTIAWFEERGIELKIEEDGRMFPITDNSQTIIDCFLSEAKKNNVEVLYNTSVKDISLSEETFRVSINQGEIFADKVIVATGSNPKIWKLLENLGHSIVNPVPSLFTFDINDERIAEIPGVVVKDVSVQVVDTDLHSEGPLLITHVGMSAPAILKLSAFGAVELAECNYKFRIEVNFIKLSFEDAVNELKSIKSTLARKTVYKFPQFEIPRRLWQKLVLAASIDDQKRWADINKEEIESLANQLTKAIFQVHGKSTFKEEFVTAGGVDLKEINFKTFESKIVPKLYFAGEVINVDAVTGGFNFQNAWTSAYIVAQHITL
ncbi:NAD(P)/FAD-dependent oxidoreductase [Winogradskyella sp. A3E31]|uniref:NAD(P)/FAD-dependent oxidoreductase n=1 Tax=Winogradskyella sp. A3E31 TaxID=3349637 RepID=UPI00398B71F1